MRKLHENNGFSLTEVLFAVGTLAIGMIFIAGVFPAGILFTTIATERTIAAVVADEAFAKIRLYADPNEYDDIDDIELTKLWTDKLTSFNNSIVFPAIVNTDPNELFTYPSDPNMGISQKQYCWSALCRLDYDPTYPVNLNRLVQVTVFVSRKIGGGTTYQGGTGMPIPMPVDVSQLSSNELQITGDKTWINDGYTIVDDKTGQIYRVLERYAPPEDDTVILLDRPWQGGSLPGLVVWVVPPSVGGGRYPCVAVYQKVIRF